MENAKDEKNAPWLSVPQFGDWDQKGPLPDYSMDFSKIREMRKQNKRELSRTSIGNEEDLVSSNKAKLDKAQPSAPLQNYGRTTSPLIFTDDQDETRRIHTPWCLNCETTSKQVEKLAKHFKGLDNLVFARIDASVNEHPKLEADDYPTLLFYPVSNKSNPIKLPTKSSLINKYLKEQAHDEQHVEKDEL